LPAGSAVRVKSRFALYSANGADAVRERPRSELFVAVFRAGRLAAELLVSGLLVVELLAVELVVELLAVELLAVELLAVGRRAAEAPGALDPDERRLAAFAALLLRAPDFFSVARVLPDRVPDCLVAMPSTVARSMPSTPPWVHYIVEHAIRLPAETGRNVTLRDRAATAEVTRGRGVVRVVRPESRSGRKRWFRPTQCCAPPSSPSG
jgi:hypothetical protein